MAENGAVDGSLDPKPQDWTHSGEGKTVEPIKIDLTQIHTVPDEVVDKVSADVEQAIKDKKSAKEIVGMVLMGLKALVKI